MVKVAVFKNGFVAKGHAGYSEHGRDIVCSAISAITQTAMLGLARYCNAVYDVYEGDISVHIAHPDVFSDLILDVMILGLKEVEAEFPTNIQVKVEGL